MIPYNFNSSTVEPTESTAEAWWFVVSGRHMLAISHPDDPKKITGFPSATNLEDIGVAPLRQHYLGTLNNKACYAAEMSEEAEPPAGYTKLSLRRMFGQIDDSMLRVAGRASHIIDWDRNHQFCGRCGTQTEHDNDRARVCPNCKLRAYPRISPAVIMLIRKEDTILLAHSKRHPSGFFSVLAGFAEPGETLEETVAREIYEEVGIQVKNIKYFGSQPWPFPDSLMIGFTCDYESGSITLHDDEIAEAAWYKAGEFPGFTPSADISIAGQLIESFTNHHT